MANQTTSSSPTRSSSVAALACPRNDAAFRHRTARKSTARTRTAKSRTDVSTLGYNKSQRVVCAISESRGVSPTVGMAFVDLDTSQAILCQICGDSQTYVRTLQKLYIYQPSQILMMSTAVQPKSKLASIIEENIEDLGANPVVWDRRHWAESTGLEYIQTLAFPEDVDTIKIAISGAYFAVCSIAAALKYVEREEDLTFAMHSLRIKYEPSQGSMMIDVSTVASLELIQNCRDTNSKDCLFAVLNETQTPMGARLLKSNILQPLTNETTLNIRYDALEELTEKEQMFFGVRQALKSYLDIDRLLTSLITIPVRSSADLISEDVNNVIRLREFISSVDPIYKALLGAHSGLLVEVCELCCPKRINPIQNLLNGVLNEDVKYSKSPLDLRNQRVFAVKVGVNGLLDVTRQTFKENTEDVISYITELGTTHDLSLELKFDDNRQYFIRVPLAQIDEKEGGAPAEFTNMVRKKKYIEFSTLELLKKNQKIIDSHHETMLMSKKIIDDLIDEIRKHASVLFKISEGLAMLDMISGFAQLATSNDYARPQLCDTLGVQACRHPIKERILRSKYVPNDIYASQQSRFQIITGCNMSGKSTYIRSVALIVVMAQIGSFVPAKYAACPIHQQLFARVSVDDNSLGNVSTFSAEMQEAAFILRNVDKHSLVIIDELGRGTSTRDGLAIATAIAEALVESRALVWFATHFVELAKIFSERSGVISLHLAVDMPDPSTLNMLYKLRSGTTKEQSYGLALASVFPLPPDVLAHATEVSETLKKNIVKQRRSSRSVILQKKRKLALKVKEYLLQAMRGNMEGENLRAHLLLLREKFIQRMEELDAMGRSADESSDVEDNDNTDVEEESAVVFAESTVEHGDEVDDEEMDDGEMEDEEGIEEMDDEEDMDDLTGSDVQVDSDAVIEAHKGDRAARQASSTGSSSTEMLIA